MLIPQKAVVHQIMEDGDPEGAIQKILTLTANERMKVQKAAFDNVRTKILKNPKYRSEQGMAELWELTHIADEKDATLLWDMIKTWPLHKIRWAQTRSNSCFVSATLMERFRKIRIVKDPFYDFTIPDEIAYYAKLDVEKVINENHTHKTEAQEVYHFTDKEIDGMIDLAKEWCTADKQWTRPCNSIKLLECLALLTGRRKWELCSTLKIRSSPRSEFQAEVQGICKQFSDKETQWRNIPLLAPISIIISGLTRLRQFPHQMGKYNHGKKLFAKLNHSRARDIYSRRAYRDRAINGFHPESCSEAYWRSQALCNSLGVFGSHYTTTVIDQQQPQLRDEAMECEAGGSCVDQQQDSI